MRSQSTNQTSVFDIFALKITFMVQLCSASHQPDGLDWSNNIVTISLVLIVCYSKSVLSNSYYDFYTSHLNSMTKSSAMNMLRRYLTQSHSRRKCSNYVDTVPKAHLFAAAFSQLTICPTVQMAGIETIWELHTLTIINSCWHKSK